MSAEWRDIDAERVRQDALGWDLEHPETFCQQCGRPNIAWYASNDDWNRATAVLPEGKVAILCPVCFVACWEAATGVPSCWEMRPSTSTLTRLVREATDAAS